MLAALMQMLLVSGGGWLGRMHTVQHAMVHASHPSHASHAHLPRTHLPQTPPTPPLPLSSAGHLRPHSPTLSPASAGMQNRRDTRDTPACMYADQARCRLLPPPPPSPAPDALARCSSNLGLVHPPTPALTCVAAAAVAPRGCPAASQPPATCVRSPAAAPGPAGPPGTCTMQPGETGTGEQGCPARAGLVLSSTL